MSNTQGYPTQPNPWTGQQAGQPAAEYSNPSFGPDYQNYGYTPTPARPASGGYAEPAGYPAPDYSVSPYAASGPTVAPWQGTGGYPYPGTFVQPEHPRSTLVMVLGILGFVTSGLTCPFAWAIGSSARREMRDYPGRWSQSSSLTLGWVLGIIGSVLWMLVIGMVVLGLALFSIAGS